MSAGNDSESSISGIVHSVHIRTGQESLVNNTSSPPRRPANNRTLSTSDLKSPEPPSNSVHIEIKNMSKSQEHLSSSIKQKHSRRSSLAPSHQGSVSVVNLKHGSVDNLPRSSSGDLATMSKNRYLSPNRQQLGSGAGSTKLRPNSLLPGRMVMGIKANSSSKSSKMKSHSVENLIDPSSTVLGLKPANSEMNILATAGQLRRRLSGTTSELNMTRIGTSEKVKVFENLELNGVTSLPAELTKGLKGQVKPDRDKIRTILGMNNVIELQRHLLTTVMENEVNICYYYN